MIGDERLQQLAHFQTRLGYTFRDVALLNSALTHASYAYEVDAGRGHYERLEFLGDAVLDLIVSTYLYTAYPAWSEGQLSKVRARLVSESSLAELARQLELGRFLLLGRGEAQSGGRDKDSLLAAAFEAVFAALYLDGGLETAQRVFWHHFRPTLQQRLHAAKVYDYKGLLQEYALHTFGRLPVYRVVREEGPPHKKTFYVQLTLDEAHTCIGVGRSKKAAEQHAAKQLFERLHPEHGSP
ncbi:MAG: ribonuclease 3 [Candidatus Tectimicrobiota bacterium]|nr:MAG: ribonuclease 3 [Candidatus Tectomicrobia bacterium]